MALKMMMTIWFNSDENLKYYKTEIMVVKAAKPKRNLTFSIQPKMYSNSPINWY